MTFLLLNHPPVICTGISSNTGLGKQDWQAPCKLSMLPPSVHDVYGSKDVVYPSLCHHELWYPWFIGFFAASFLHGFVFFLICGSSMLLRNCGTLGKPLHLFGSQCSYLWDENYGASLIALLINPVGMQRSRFDV